MNIDKKDFYIPPTPIEIREYLKKYKLSQTELARKLRVSSRTVRRWVAGAHKLPYAVFIIMAIEVGPWNCTENLLQGERISFRAVFPEHYVLEDDFWIKITHEAHSFLVKRSTLKRVMETLKSPDIITQEEFNKLRRYPIK